jgi:hypothetical protein
VKRRRFYPWHVIVIFIITTGISLMVYDKIEADKDFEQQYQQEEALIATMEAST